MKGEWVSYRPEIKVLDCTVRDGGLMNNHNLNAFINTIQIIINEIWLQIEKLKKK